MSYLRYLCLFGQSGIQHILCCVFCFLCLRLVADQNKSVIKLLESIIEHNIVISYVTKYKYTNVTVGRTY